MVVRFVPPALLVLSGAVTGGCGLLPVGGGPTASPGGIPSPMGSGLREYRVAFHCHSHLSHDSEVPFDRIAAAAREIGFDAVILGDHYRPGAIARMPRGAWDGILLIPGVEIRPEPPGGPPSPGSLLVFGLDGDFEPRTPRPDLLRERRPRGALAAAGHAEEREGGWAGLPLDAFEVYNLHAQFSAASRLLVALRLLLFFPDRFFEGAIEPDRKVLGLWDRELAGGRRLAPLAGHDAHENVRILGATVGTYPEILRLFSNRILAADCTTEGILDGIRRGRTFVAFDFLGDPAGFSVTYGPPGASPGTAATAILGDDAPYSPGSVLEVRLPAGGTIRVLRDGAVWREVRGHTLAEPLPGPGTYRVEADRAAGLLGGRRLWIIAAPIRVAGVAP